MFVRLSAFTLLALPLLATATVLPRQDTCASGSAQCCNSVQSYVHRSGVTCSPITGIGAGGTDCSDQPVCCTDNSYNGVVALGCTPINVGL
ncbi:hydrophobin-251 [Guyanagaster necrorhizus]|uniref:Hydrophobin n=1 Tax=Guyanagaster necrorhizus TaxID=856835 RepID=A0A9P7VTC7_9AGAR|nr:hydrophobin-251 [Guyanagaster necrorhizus MCA 3950]XP_043035161.1 hydrophobin-251 [Guyanagaster necrorhizus MCA 3950]XP_043039698.1 hydrophobin-251 [Guyanagaster necrorhizus MCA 3950]XP_043039702.1 hydrophobin-251 [Guyanagaster necrorhizus MCA 3950]KAG7441657.1 hydrophobin-251 [Guyanagaster necrorhizus MCA 3950]KAG7441661.1 hydrophobin-251 [Guyanagaster necrorhizus MCA 3950]KAG7446198.1 hydrophobin-251 [Guyanagaster necrorhizus MCA 3950]KAG7446202.1 hydrophobin-251 [Guyanagaster necrorhiz